jgi:hypothetical protein
MTRLQAFNEKLARIALLSKGGFSQERVNAMVNACVSYMTCQSVGLPAEPPEFTFLDFWELRNAGIDPMKGIGGKDTIK